MARALARGWGEPVLAHRRRLRPRGARWPPSSAARRSSSNRELAERADLVILAHKPAQLEAVAREVGGAARGRRLAARRARPLAELRGRLPGRAGRSASSRTRRSRSRRGVTLLAEPADEPARAARSRSCSRASARSCEVPEPLMRRRRGLIGRRPRLLGAGGRGAGRRRRSGAACRRRVAQRLVTRDDGRHAPSSCAPASTTRSRCAARSPRRAARPRAGWPRSSAAACARRSPTRWTPWWRPAWSRASDDRRLPRAR